MKSELNQEEIINKISDYVKLYFIKNLPGWIRYHNLDHTIETVEGCLEIGSGLKISNTEKEILIIAAWFHDIGYNISANEHEKESVNIAENFLKSINYPNEKINRVSEIIRATKITNVAENILEQIIKDADLISLGKKSFNSKNDLLKKEIELRDKIKIKNISWIKRSVEFLSTHQFLTDYAKEIYNNQQSENLRILREQLNREGNN